MKRESRMQVDWFGSRGSRQELKRKSVRGTLVNSVGRAANQVLRLGSLMILARILAPADFGLIAMITAVVGIASVLQEGGFSAATIRARTITHDQVSNLFWVNTSAGFGMALLIVISAPWLGSFYGDPRVEMATVVMASGFALGGATIQHHALLRRAMRFNDIAKINLLSTTLVAVVSIAGAQAGLAHWALIAGSVAGSVAGCLLGWSYCDWRPGRVKTKVGTRSLVVFGWHMMVFGILGFFAKNVHSLIIGRMWGAAEAGLYSRAEFLRRLVAGNVARPLGLVVPVGMATLQDEPASYCRYYYKCTAVALMVAIPVAFVGMAMPHELIQVLLGAQWARSADLLQILAFSVVPQVILSTTGWVYLSGGNSVLMMWWGIVAWTLLICATVAGSIFGVVGIAWSSTLASWALLGPGLWFAYRSTPLRFVHLLAYLYKPVAAGLLAGAISQLAVADTTGAMWRLVIALPLFGGIYLALLLTVFGQRALILDIMNQLKRRGRKTANPSGLSDGGAAP